MSEDLEGTPEFNRHHRLVTGEVPIVASDSAVYDMFQRDPMHDDDPDPE